MVDEVCAQRPVLFFSQAETNLSWRCTRGEVAGIVRQTQPSRIAMPCTAQCGASLLSSPKSRANGAAEGSYACSELLSCRGAYLT